MHSARKPIVKAMVVGIFILWIIAFVTYRSGGFDRIADAEATEEIDKDIASKSSSDDSIANGLLDVEQAMLMPGSKSIMLSNETSLEKLRLKVSPPILTHGNNEVSENANEISGNESYPALDSPRVVTADSILKRDTPVMMVSTKSGYIFRPRDLRVRKSKANKRKTEKATPDTTKETPSAPRRLMSGSKSSPIIETPKKKDTSAKVE
ncbi:MAG: hypothetical protein H7Y42_02540 [Chitinophagaceae bacterium]|nr:hypothetical protein [Chitinophagaceae bacterium]